MRPGEAAAEALLAAFDGDGTRALLYIARRFDIAVAYIDRQTFERHLGRDLSDDEWDEIAPSLGGYDEHVCNYGDDPEGEFIDALLEEAGIDADPFGCGHDPEGDWPHHTETTDETGAAVCAVDGQPFPCSEAETPPAKAN